MEPLPVQGRRVIVRSQFREVEQLHEFIDERDPGLVEDSVLFAPEDILPPAKRAGEKQDTKYRNDP